MTKNYTVAALALSLLLSFYICSVSPDDYNEDGIPKINEKDVSKWADSIGKELWEIGKRVTKLDAIKERYNDMNATVQPTDGDVILKTIVSRMNKLIKEKVDAVMRIRSAAVKAENRYINLAIPKNNVTYRNSKFSIVQDTNLRNIIIEPDYQSTAGQDEFAYTEMILSPNSHFKDVMVNTSYSSVHVPTNIFDRWDKVIQPIAWSEELDEVFKGNYENDPTLMWQYYASTSGFLRHFPAFHWSMDPDKYDCRKSIWYIQAATCSKEVIVLIDNSGTMYGMRNTIAQLTVDSLLQTFSNNDYVNIFRLYDDNVTCLVPCFNDTLIQATPENVALFKQALYDMCPGNKINFTKGFLKAFEMLHDFLENKTEQAERRNQAIFLLTDMLPPQTEMLNIRKEYERVYNDTNIQVELFIYFIGRDVPEIRVVQWEKCLRNGSIVHVRTMDEVPEDVLKYLPVMARTQNENTENYPISWTHVFLDIKKAKGTANNDNQSDKMGSADEIAEEEHAEYGNLNEPHIMTSVTTPVYSTTRKTHLSSGKEEMIGVAAIDVPVADFEKLTIPHKIGVNGYAFIVTNNGYLLFHPDLTPVKDGTFRENFNSVDLTEVEFYDDDENEPRKPNENIVELRRKMVNQENGNMTNLSIKFHFDNQKRVGSELRNYFFAPLKCSPFTLGLALPRGYGNYWIKTTDEIEMLNIKEQNYLNFFTGNWSVHPKWTYCDFRDERKYDYKNTKEKLLKFFEMIFSESRDNFTWNVEHPGENIDDLNYVDSPDGCIGNDTTQKPSQNYFCDKELMELLFFDAKLTHHEFSESISKDDVEFIESKKILLKFVSTQSGLTRWEYFGNETLNPEKRSFGETNNKALDEVWYKSAVLLHQLKSQNFVFSLPEASESTGEKYITASHAIFHNDAENEAPGVVVGFQIPYQTIKELIENVSLCGKSHSDCYIIDANGYVVYAQDDIYLGKFFGDVEGAVMEQMTSSNIFRKLSMYDYQAFAENSINKPEQKSTTNNASVMLKPFTNLLWMLKWTFSKVFWFLLEMDLLPRIYASKSCSSFAPESKAVSDEESPPCRKAPKAYSNEACKTREVPSHIEKLDEIGNRMKKIPVDKRFSLYLFTNLSANGSKMGDDGPSENCSRPFFANRINYTNLILISVDTTYQTCFKNSTVSQTIIEYPTANKTIPACNKKMINSYPRKKLRGCSNKILENRPTTETCGSTRIFQVATYTRLMYCAVLSLCNCFFTVSLVFL